MAPIEPLGIHDNDPSTPNSAATAEKIVAHGGAYVDEQIEILAPKLAPIVTILEFDAEGKGGDSKVDDTALYAEAVLKMDEIGGGTLIATPQRKNGERAMWTIGSNPGGHATCVRFGDNLTISAYGAQFQALSTGTHALFGEDFNQAPTTSLTAVNVRWLGGHFVGTGKESFNQFCITAGRTNDWVVRDLEATNWGTENGTGILNFGGPQRLRVEDTTMVNCCKAGGFNAINVGTGQSGSNELPTTEIFITGNIGTGCGAAPICVQLTKEDTYVNTKPIRCNITNNISETTGFCGIILEMGGSPTAPLGHMNEIILGFNHASYTGANSGSHFAMAVTNDSTPLVESALNFYDIHLIHNQCNSTRNGIQCHGSFSLLESNDISAANVGIYCTGATASVTVTHVKVRGGFVKMADGGVSQGVWFQRVADGLIDTDISYATGTTGSGIGVMVQECKRVRVKSEISLTASYGVVVKAALGPIWVEAGTSIFNPSTNATVAAVRVEGECTGNVYVKDIDARDEREVKKMKYGIDASTATGAGKVSSERNVLLGWTSKAWNGLSGKQIDDTIDESIAIWRGERREVWVNGEAPKEGTYAPGDKANNRTPTEAAPTAFWLCVKASPLTWVAK
jgi:hypothetical protein